MFILNLILKEIGHRKLNAVLGALAVITAVGFYTSFLTTGQASKNETTRIMRDIGYNIRIIPKSADVDRFWAQGYADETMPEEYVMKFTQLEGYAYAHLLATLQKRIDWRGMNVFLTGITAEVAPPDHQKSSMIFSIKPGTVYAGSEIATREGLAQGDAIEVMGKSFTIERVLKETGSEDDVRLYAQLHDVQELLGQPGRINEIKALDCICLIPNIDPVAVLRQQLETILPEARLFHVRNIASARENQRQMMENYFALLIPLVTFVCAVWIGALAMINTRERRQEIGILRALGYGSGTVLVLFLGKAVLLGLTGAVFGFAAGTGLALFAGPSIFHITARSIVPLYGMLGWAVWIAPLFAAVSSFIPALIAVTQDPAETLRET